MDKKHRNKNGPPDGSGLSRRDFLASAGISTLGAATAAGVLTADAASPVQASSVLEAAETVKVTLRINGRDHDLLVEPRESLLHVLRERLGLTGTKVGCDRGECGACTVLIDDRPRYACLTLALEAEGFKITTLEGLMQGEELGAVQQAFLENDAFQCGYCTPGQIMAVEGLLRANPDPSLGEIRLGASGNLCRCGAYRNIFKAARRAAELKQAAGGGA